MIYIITINERTFATDSIVDIITLSDGRKRVKGDGLNVLFGAVDNVEILDSHLTLPEYIIFFHSMEKGNIPKTSTEVENWRKDKGIIEKTGIFARIENRMLELLKMPVKKHTDNGIDKNTLRKSRIL